MSPDSNQTRPTLLGIERPDLPDVPLEALANKLQDRPGGFRQATGLRENARGRVLQRDEVPGLLVLDALDCDYQVVTFAPREAGAECSPRGGQSCSPPLRCAGHSTRSRRPGPGLRAQSRLPRGDRQNDAPKPAPPSVASVRTHELESSWIHTAAPRGGGHGPKQDRASLGQRAELQPPPRLRSRWPRKACSPASARS